MKLHRSYKHKTFNRINECMRPTRRLARTRRLCESTDDLRVAMEKSGAYNEFWSVWDRFTEFCNDVGFRWNDQHDVYPFGVVEIAGDGKMIVWEDEEPRMPYDRYVIAAGALKPNGDVNLSAISDVAEYRERLESRPRLGENIDRKVDKYSEFYDIMVDWHRVFVKAKFLKVSGDEADDLFYGG